MSNRQNIMTLINGKVPETIPWAPRLGIWYNAHKIQKTLPNEFRELTLREIEKRLGVAACSSARLPFIFLRHAARSKNQNNHIVRVSFKSVTVESYREKNREYVIYHTPIGEATEMYHISLDAELKGLPFAKHLTKPLIDSVEKYAVAEYIYNDMEFTPTYSIYEQIEQNTGEHGVPIVNLVYDPIYLIMEQLVGFNNFYYELNDNRKYIERLYNVLCKKFETLFKIAINSPAEFIISAAHYNVQFVPPEFYDDYIKPVLKPFGRKLKQHGKLLGLHADADTSNLLEKILDTGFELLDVFICAPMAKITLTEAIEICGLKVVIWGGLPSILFDRESYDDITFKDEIKRTLHLIRESDNRVILGISDQLMPESDINRVRIVSELILSF